MSKDKYDDRPAPDARRATRLIGWWTTVMQRYAALVIAIVIAATAGALFYSVRNFRINTDFNSMISEKLHFRKLQRDFDKSFPQLSDTIVIVLDADTPEHAMWARKRLSSELRKQQTLFRTVYEPGGGEFFERNGLLYLGRAELGQLSDKLAEAQPFLAFLSQDLSSRGLFSVLEMALTRKELGGAQGGTVNKLLDRVDSAFESVTAGKPRQISWEEMMLGNAETAAQRRQFIITQPVFKASEFTPGETALEAVHGIARQLEIDAAHGVAVHITGDTALAKENMDEVRNSTGAAAIVSLILVGIVLYVGLGGSGRLVAASLATLLTGLIWTTGFALLAIGSLNLISITFAVLFIGLGIDYCIQFCLRYKELVDSGCGDREGIIIAAKGVGKSLMLSCITIAIGFYSFVPTAYSGVAELGLISGTGMFISLFATLTLLPALLTIAPVRKKEKRPLSSFGETLVSLPYRYPAPITGAAFVLGVLSIMIAPKVFFNYNPLDLYQESSECVSTIRELCKDVNTQPWTASILVRGKESAQALAEKLRRLKEVKMVISISDFIPERQTEKLGIISGTSLFMPPNLANSKVRHLNYEQNMAALKRLEKTLQKSPLASSRRLYESIQRFKQLLTGPEQGDRAFSALETSMLSGLPMLFDMLAESMKATAVTESGLPRQLLNQYVSADGRYRVQVFPEGDIMNPDRLKRFVKAVGSVTPDATDSPITIYESGRAVISSFQQATVSAIIVITIFLIIELRGIFVTGLILTPLLLAMLMTAAASVLLHIPLNFANVIVVPVLLGIGVHSGIIFMLRAQTEPPLHGNMLKTSTARAILFSSVTLLISTGSLSFSLHRGISSMGILLSICLCFVLAGTLILLPALLQLSKRRPGPGRQIDKKSS